MCKSMFIFLNIILFMKLYKSYMVEIVKGNNFCLFFYNFVKFMNF